MSDKDESSIRHENEDNQSSDDESQWDTSSTEDSSLLSFAESSESGEGLEAKKKKKKKKPRRCEFPTCRTRLLLTSYACRCEKFFCPLHVPSEEHDCEFDYHGMARKKIRRDNPKVIGRKIRKI